jgi:hypothetical protein
MGRAANPQHLVVGLKDASRLVQDQLAELGGGRSVDRFGEEIASHHRLYPLDLGADGGLAQAQSFGRLGQAAGLGDRHEHLKCSYCRTQVYVIKIESDKDGGEIRTFGFPHCAASKSLRLAPRRQSLKPAELTADQVVC